MCYILREAEFVSLLLSAKQEGIPLDVNVQVLFSLLEYERELPVHWFIIQKGIKSECQFAISS